MSEEPRFVTDKQGLLALESEYHERWRSGIRGVAPEATRGDGWPLKAVVAHVAAWQRQATGRLREIDGGRTDPGPPDVDAFNAEVLAASRIRPWQEIEADAEHARREFREIGEALPEEVFPANERLVAYVWGSNGLYHYAEHSSDRVGA